MNKKKILDPAKHEIPDGEGFNALPIAFASPHPRHLTQRERGEKVINGY